MGIIGVVAISCLFSIGCKEKSADSASDLAVKVPVKPVAQAAQKIKRAPFQEPASLIFVPDDTPYFFASVDALPKGVSKHISQWMAPLWEMSRQEISKRRMRGDEAVQLNSVEKVLFAALEELGDDFGEKGWSKLGLNSSHFVIYGVGILPVLRIEVQDAKALREFISRVQEKSGIEFPEKELGKDHYWSVEEQGISFVLCVKEKELVAGVMASALQERYLPMLLGQAKPAVSLSESKRISKLASAYESNPNGIGFVDLEKLSATFLGNASGFNGEVARTLGIKPDSISEENKERVVSFAEKCPQLSFGYEGTSDLEVESWMALSVNQELGEQLKGCVAPAANVEYGYPEGDFLFSMGLAVDMSKVEPLIKAFYGGLKQGLSGQRNPDFMAMGEILKQPLPPFILGLKGLSVVLYDIVPDFKAPRDIKALISVHSDDPMQLVTLAQNSVPPLAKMKIDSNGKPVPFPKEVAIPFVKNPQVAVLGNILAISLGEGNETSMKSVLHGKSISKPPVFTAAVNYSKMMRKIGSAWKEEMMQKAAHSGEAYRKGQEFALQFMESLDKAAYAFYVDEKGVSARARMGLR